MTRSRTVRLRDVVTIRSGNTPSRTASGYWRGTRPWISAKDMKSRVVSTSQERLTDSGWAVASLAPSGSVLILTRGMTLFRDVPVCLAAADVAFNQDVKALLASDEVDSAYLAHYLRGSRRALMSLVDTAGHGTGRLDTDALADFPVALPPLAEQKHIAGVLDVWDRAIEASGRLQRAKHRALAWLRRRVIDEPVASRAWASATLGDVCRPVTRKNTTGETRALTTSAKLGLIDQSEFFSRDVTGIDSAGYYLLKRGEFAYNRSASEGYPHGAIKRLDAYDTGILSPLYICFGLVDEDVSADFLNHFFESGVMNRQLGRICQVGSRAHGLLNVSRSDFFSLPVVVPPRAEQDEIVAILDAGGQEIRVLRSLDDCYSRQKRALARAFLSRDGDDC